MKPHAYIFIGRAGAGKGTQAKLLIDYIKEHDSVHPLLYIETGALLRKYVAEKDNFTSKMTKNVIDRGGLMPEFMPIYIWSSMIVEHYQGEGSVVFDGTPRKLAEAKALDSLFPFYGMEKPWVIYLDIEHEESGRRLAIRAKEGRADDDKEAVERRRVAFETDVLPVVEYYRKHPGFRFLDIKGERPIEVVHQDIVDRISA